MAQCRVLVMKSGYPCIFVAFHQIGAQGRLANNVNLAITINAHVNDRKSGGLDSLNNALFSRGNHCAFLSLLTLKKNKITRLQEFG